MAKKVIGIIIIMALVVIMIFTFVKKQLDEQQAAEEEQSNNELNLESTGGAQKGEIAPDFTLSTLDGKEITLSDLKGKKVVLNFWATWCPPCKKEIPDFQSYYEKNAKDENVEIVAVNLAYIRNTKEEEIQQFLDDNGVTFTVPVMNEENKSIAETYKVLSIPSTFMLDTEGRIQYQILGPLDESKLDEYISKLN